MDDIFDILAVRSQRVKSFSSLKGCDFLFEKAATRLCGNLADIKRDFPKCLVIGRRGSDAVIEYLKSSKDAEVVDLYDASFGGDDEFPHVQSGQYDLVISMPFLHQVNDVPGALAMFKAALKPDGVFLCSLFGGQTLMELRDAFTRAELDLKGGAGQHIHPMIDHYQFAGLLQRAGFALPVADYERVTVSYGALNTLYDDLKGMGERNVLVARSKTVTGKRLFTSVEKEYRQHHLDKDERFNATFDILFGIGWAPHESQQQPAKRGSGDTSLTEVL